MQKSAQGIVRRTRGRGTVTGQSDAANDAVFEVRRMA